MLDYEKIIINIPYKNCILISQQNFFVKSLKVDIGLVLFNLTTNRQNYFIFLILLY